MSTKTVKLTRAQSEALWDLKRFGPQRWNEAWPPGRALVEKGLATKEFGGLGSPKFTATYAGINHPDVATA